jgi:hypothetical protein
MLVTLIFILLSSCHIGLVWYVFGGRIRSACFESTLQQCVALASTESKFLTMRKAAQTPRNRPKHMKVHFVLLVVMVLGLTCQAEDVPKYAGQQKREIKALSEAEVSAYLDGRGMGLAKAAELNGYPGPAHVLDLAEKLQLTPQQQGTTTQGLDERGRNFRR